MAIEYNVKNLSRRVSPKTVEIIKELILEAHRIRESGSGDRGFRTRLARRYGLTRGRITNIARDYARVINEDV